jgi:transcriptional regulator with GAF, ATPase, and Fis domain
MSFAEITAIIGGIKSITEIAKGLKSAYDSHTVMQAQADILEKLTNLQMDALALQEKASSLINEKDELQKKVTEFEQWKETEADYELKEITTGKFVYAFKETGKSQKPSHWLCTNCYGQRKKSILQASYHGEFDATYFCPNCNLQMILNFKDRPKGGSHSGNPPWKVRL